MSPNVKAFELFKFSVLRLTLANRLMGPYNIRILLARLLLTPWNTFRSIVFIRVVL